MDLERIQSNAVATFINNKVIFVYHNIDVSVY